VHFPDASGEKIKKRFFSANIPYDCNGKNNVRPVGIFESRQDLTAFILSHQKR